MTSSLPILEIINQYLNSKDEVYFIQIGSNDGKLGDPLREKILAGGWSGVLIEPVKYIFNKLKNNYKDYDGLAFENVAIADESGEKEFFYLRETNDPLPRWYSQIGSFKKDVVMSHKKYIPNIEEYLVCEKMPCTTICEVIARHQFPRIDLLHIDTEGYDFEIIKTIDFNAAKPTLILYEHKHLTDIDRQECKSFLSKQSYRFSEQKNDTLAYLTIDAM